MQIKYCYVLNILWVLQAPENINALSHSQCPAPFLAACIKSLIPVPMEQSCNKKNGQEGQKLPIVTGLPQTLTAIIEVLLLN